jgi:hypothetical protein
MANVTRKRLLADFERLMATAKSLPLRRVKGVRGAVYRQPDGLIRVRTNNKPVFMTPSELEREDFLGVVIVLNGKIHAYCAPSKVVARDLAEAREAWMAEDPEHRHDNRTPVLQFDGEGKAWNGFADKWRQYHVGEAEIEEDGIVGAAEAFRRAVRAEHPNAVVHIAVDPTGNGGALVHL